MISPLVLARQRGEKVRRHRRSGRPRGAARINAWCRCGNQLAWTNTSGECAWCSQVRKLVGMGPRVEVKPEELDPYVRAA